jgi:hypothetical protein
MLKTGRNRFFRDNQTIGCSPSNLGNGCHFLRQKTGLNWNLKHYPLYRDGVGLEDFEECERTFGKSNELAAVTRLASPYHHAQHINEHFRFHDQDKHAASGTSSINHQDLLDVFR